MRAGWLTVLIALTACGGGGGNDEREAPESAPENTVVETPGDTADSPIEIAADSTGPDTWTTGTASAPSTVVSETALLTALRPGRHSDFERVVLELNDRGGGFPEYKVEYVDRPLHDCGSGEETFPIGDAWLEIRLYPVDAHTQEGQPTISHRPRDLPGLENLKRVYTTCDFEAVVIVVLAMGKPNEFRVFELDAPRRIVVDVRKK